VKERKFNGGTLQALIEGMKTTNKIIIAIGITSLAALPLMAGPVVTVQVGVPAPPPVVVVAPAPAVTVEVGVPDTYVWDGVEFVGVVGGAYYYLGPGNVWINCDSDRLARFHDWERGHADWRTHATVNVNFRTDAHGHNVPRHDAVQHDAAPPSHDASHDNHDKDKDNDHDH
jgi:hypothetical protein